MTDRKPIALAGLAAVLVALLVLEYHGARTEDATLPPASRRPNAAQTGIPPGALPVARDEARAHVEAILARPLFRADRRPPPADAAAGASSVALPRLTGVLVSAEGRSVIFAGGADGKPVVVAEGGRIGRYVVQSIGAGEATLFGPDGTRTLRPAFGQGGATASGPLAPTPARAPAGPSILDLLRSGGTPSVGIPGLPPIGGGSAAPGGRP